MGTVSLEIRDAAEGASTARLMLDRPAIRNALNFEMCRDLLDAARLLAGRDDIACVELCANGPVFCAGADLKERASISDDEIRGRRLLAFRAYDAIETLPMPVIAVVDGGCIGSGCEIAAACDFIVASDRAFFQYPEIQRGTVGATQRLPRLIGLPRAKELLFTGRIVDAAEAQAIGLVNRTVPSQLLAETVARIVSETARAPVEALRQAKRALDGGRGDSRDGALAREILAIEDNLDSGEWKIGMRLSGKGNSAVET